MTNLQKLKYLQTSPSAILFGPGYRKWLKDEIVKEKQMVDKLKKAGKV